MDYGVAGRTLVVRQQVVSAIKKAPYGAFFIWQNHLNRLVVDVLRVVGLSEEEPALEQQTGVLHHEGSPRTRPSGPPSRNLLMGRYCVEGSS